MATAKKKPITKKKARIQATKIDWTLARNEYLADSTLSYSDIAKKYKISKKSVGDRGKAEGWTELRQELSEKAFTRFTEKLLDTKAQANNRHLQHYQNLQAIANMAIQDMAERSYERDSKGKLLLYKGNPVPVPINTFALEKLAKAVKDAINGERVILGLPTSVSAISDPEGNNVWTGFSDMVKAAEKVLAEMETAQAEAVRKLWKASKASPPFFNEWILGGSFWSKQEEIILSVRDNRYTTVRACHDVGKTYVAARTALWYLNSHPQSIVVTTAPTMRQVENLLWRELRAAHEASKQPLGGEPLKTRLDISPDWYAIGASSGDPDKLQGFHAASGHILIIIDEAAGVNEDAFEAIEGMMTSELARMLMIGNPTSDAGSFRASHHSWDYANKIHISVFDSPNFVNNGIKTIEDLRKVNLDNVEIVNPYLVSPRWAFEKIDTWGVDSPMFQARVLGNFPSESTNTIIPLNYLELAYEEEHRKKLEEAGGPLRLGVDPARFGNDETVITPRYGGFIPEQTVHSKTSIPATVGLVKQYNRPRPVFIGIDVDGLGGGVYDNLLEDNIDGVAEIYNNAKALPDSTGLTFANLASQLWWRARDMFIAGELAIPKDEKLVMQLSTRKYKFTNKGLTVESKDDWKKRFKGKSPDRADSLIYSLADIISVEDEAKATTGRDTSSKIKERMRE